MILIKFSCIRLCTAFSCIVCTPLDVEELSTVQIRLSTATRFRILGPDEHEILLCRSPQTDSIETVYVGQRITVVL